MDRVQTGNGTGPRYALLSGLERLLTNTPGQRRVVNARVRSPLVARDPTVDNLRNTLMVAWSLGISMP